MNKKELFEATMQEPPEERGQAIFDHITEILEPFREIGLMDWVWDWMTIAWDTSYEDFRPNLHSDKCMKSMTETHWMCICGFNTKG